jgi:hypothetical protein
MRKNGQEPLIDEKPHGAGEKVDLNDLEWEDRERVLRLLFSKMNAGVTPSALIKRQAKRERQGQVQQISEMGVYLEQSEDNEQPLPIEY